MRSQTFREIVEPVLTEQLAQAPIKQVACGRRQIRSRKEPPWIMGQHARDRRPLEGDPVAACGQIYPGRVPVTNPLSERGEATGDARVVVHGDGQPSSQIAGLVARPRGERSRQPEIAIRTRTEPFDERPAMTLMRAESPCQTKACVLTEWRVREHRLRRPPRAADDASGGAQQRGQKSTFPVQPETQLWGPWAVA